MGRIPYQNRSPFVEHLFQTTTPIPAAQPPYPREGDCQLPRAQTWRTSISASRFMSIWPTTSSSTTRPPNADAVANCHSLQRQNELLKAELAATRKAHDASATATPPTRPAVTTPSPSRPSESVASSACLPMASAAAADGKSLDKNFAKSPILNSLHGRSPRPPHDKKQDDPILAATDSTHHARPQEILEYRDCLSSMLPLRQRQPQCSSGPTILHVSTPVVTLNLVLLCFNKHASGGIFPIYGGHVGFGARLHHQARRQSAVHSNCHSTHSRLIRRLNLLSY